MNDKPNARELLKECRGALLRGQADEQMAMVAGIDAYLAAPSNACPKCDGKGWTAEHSADANAHDGEGNCNPGYCPVQVQCEACGGTGRATPGESAMEMVDKLEELLNLDRAIFPPKDSYEKAAALIEGLQRRVPRKMLDELWDCSYGSGGRGMVEGGKDAAIDAIAAKHGVEVEK